MTNPHQNIATHLLRKRHKMLKILIVTIFILLLVTVGLVIYQLVVGTFDMGDNLLFSVGVLTLMEIILLTSRKKLREEISKRQD